MPAHSTNESPSLRDFFDDFNEMNLLSSMAVTYVTLHFTDALGCARDAERLDHIRI